MVSPTMLSDSALGFPLVGAITSVFPVFSFREFALQNASMRSPCVCAEDRLKQAALTSSAWAEHPTFRPRRVSGIYAHAH